MLHYAIVLFLFYLIVIICYSYKNSQYLAEQGFDDFVVKLDMLDFITRVIALGIVVPMVIYGIYYLTCNKNH